jgi:hypothetical protein
MVGGAWPSTDHFKHGFPLSAEAEFDARPEAGSAGRGLKGG